MRNYYTEKNTALLLMLIVTLFVAAPAAAQSPEGALRLIGAIESSTFTGAVLADSSGAQFFYRIHEQLPDGSRIVKVESDSIRVKRSDGTVYELFINHDMSRSSPASRAPVAASAPSMPVPPAAASSPSPASFEPGQRRSRSNETPGKSQPHRREPGRGGKQPRE